MEDLERFAVPPAPVHVSNSTDPFQPLEREMRHTRYALEQILAHPWSVHDRDHAHQETLAAGEGRLHRPVQGIDGIPGRSQGPSPFPGISFEVQVSLAFWREAARRAYDGNAPRVASRCKGIQALTDAGIPVVLRVDPLFPRLPLRSVEKSMKDFGLDRAPVP